MVSFPVSAVDVDADWMNAALAESGRLGNYRVVSCTAKDSDVPGQTAEIVQIAVEYDDEACELPRRFIAKITSRNAMLIEQVIKIYDLYRRETSFYNEFKESGIASPDCFVSQHNPETQEMVILMGDLAPATSPSWAPSPEQTEQALANLPAFHAKWWNSPMLRSRDWFVQFDNRDFFFSGASAANMAIPMLEEHFGDAGEHTAQLMRIFLEHLDTIQSFYAARPFTFVHGDYHPKQMFFPSEAGGEFAVIDWQFPFVAQGAWDFVRMMVLGLDVENRRRRQDALIDAYYKSLIANGVENYTREDLDTDLKIGLVVNQMIMMVALIDTDISLVEKECSALGLDWKDVLLMRGEAAVRDWNVVDFAKSLVQ